MITEDDILGSSLAPHLIGVFAKRDNFKKKRAQQLNLIEFD